VPLGTVMSKEKDFCACFTASPQIEVLIEQIWENIQLDLWRLHEDFYSLEK